MSAPTPPRRPGAFRLDEAELELPEIDLLDAIEPEADAHDAVEAIVHPRRRRGVRWGRLVWTGLTGLVSLGVGLAIDDLLRDLFARADWLGWFGVALLALLVLGLAAFIVRETVGILRLKKVAKLRLEADRVHEANDRTGALSLLARLTALYAERPDTARGRKALRGYRGDVIDGRDLLVLAERDLLAPLDERARRMVSSSAQRVTAVTALSPRALVDVAFVLYEAMRLVRRVSTHYGGRPGTLGMMRLMRSVIAHLAVTGGVAVGDTLVQQVLGHGVAAKLSARLGEGVVNGVMTARLGIAAIDVCRPLPFVGEKPPSLATISRELTRAGRDESDA